MKTMMLLSLILAGCATQPRTYWDKPDVSQEQKQKEFLECKYEATKAVGSSPSGSITTDTESTIANDIAAGARLNEIMNLCLQTKGFVQVRK